MKNFQLGQLNLRDQQGFTLVELLATIVIMGAALVPLMNGFVHSWRATMEAKKTSLATMLARKHVEEIIGAEDYANISTGSAEGEFAAPYDEYSYETEIEKISGTDPDLEVKRIQIRVIFPTLFGSGSRTVSCVSNASGCEKWDFATFVAKRSV